jgi:hypothetical protein
LENLTFFLLKKNHLINLAIVLPLLVRKQLGTR